MISWEHIISWEHVQEHILETGVATLIIWAVYAVSLWWTRAVEPPKRRVQLRARLLYTAVLLQAMGLAQIWLEGFGPLLTALGLVAAGLVIAMKEVVLSMIAWSVMMWRNVFSEGDYIYLNGMGGYVHSIGWLYLTLQEKSVEDDNRLSGKILKVPNYWVLLYPVANYSYTSELLEYRISIVLTLESDIVEAKKIMLETMRRILKMHALKKTTQKLYRRAHDQFSVVYTKPSVAISLLQDDYVGARLTLSFYTHPWHRFEIEQLFLEKLLMKLRQSETMHLAMRCT